MRRELIACRNDELSARNIERGWRFIAGILEGLPHALVKPRNDGTRCLTAMETIRLTNRRHARPLGSLRTKRLKILGACGRDARPYIWTGPTLGEYP